ncbi:PAS domain-containing sensor histidine kinase [Parvularcula oceani]|uniref:sensor histidine kinase n=1 Tax=Parvularcula oceani TaxID=1247963 RepID=UPI0006915126|nr:PAS domain-containing protein [Parvularcula oceani]
MLDQIGLWQAVCENATLAMFITDKRQHCIYMNPAAEALTGYSLAETKGRPLHDVVHHTRPDGSPHPLEECPIDQAFPENMREQGEEVFVHKDGSFYPVAFTASPLRDDDGQPVGTIIEVRGTAEEIAAKDKLLETEHRLQFALSAGRAVGTWEWDVPGDAVRADSRFASLFGIAPEKAERGMAIETFIGSIDPRDRERVTGAIWRALETGEDYEQEYRVAAPDGRAAWVLARGRCFYGDGGRPVSFPGVVVDITHQKEQALELARREAEFRTMTEAMPQIVWATRPDGHHDFYNARWYEFTGVPEGSTDGEGWSDLFHPDDQGEAWQRWRHSLATGEPYEVEYRLRHHTGVYRWTIGRALPVRDGEGSIVRWLGTCTDVHDLKLAKEHADLLAKELNHRVKNTLQTVQAIASHSLRRLPGHETAYEDFIGRIQALSGVHSLLTKAEWRPTDLGTVLRLALTPFGLDEKGDDRFTLHGPRIELDAKKTQSFAMALHELATNAAKYGALSNQEGKVIVTWTCKNDQLALEWRERGGPAVEEPKRRGFGSLMLTRLLSMEIQGEISIAFDKEGVVCRMTGRV